jgi:polysaccharide biosynthesis protein PslH
MAEVFFAQLSGLSEFHEVCLITPTGPEPWEFEAAADLAAGGFDVHAVERHMQDGAARWGRRARLASRWALAREPWRTVWFHERGVQGVIDRLVHERRFDVIAVEDNSMATYSFPPSIPRVLTEHEVRRPRKPAPPRGRPIAHWAFQELDWARWRQYQRRTWDRFNAVHVFSRRDAELAADIAPSISARIEITPFGVVIPDPGSSAPTPGTVAFVGNFTHPPNVDAAHWLAAEIFPEVRRSAPWARLAIAGPHAPASVEALGRLDGVDVLGYVPDIDEFLLRAAVVVAPVRIGGGMRMKVLHSMALGRPTVTTSRGIDGVIAPLGAVRVADDTIGFATTVAVLLSDPAAAERLGAAGRAAVLMNHSPSAYAERLTEKYSRMVERPAAQRLRGDDL